MRVTQALINDDCYTGEIQCRNKHRFITSVKVDGNCHLEDSEQFTDVNRLQADIKAAVDSCEQLKQDYIELFTELKEAKVADRLQEISKETGAVADRCREKLRELRTSISEVQGKARVLRGDIDGLQLHFSESVTTAWKDQFAKYVNTLNKAFDDATKRCNQLPVSVQSSDNGDKPTVPVVANMLRAADIAKDIQSNLFTPDNVARLAEQLRLGAFFAAQPTANYHGNAISEIPRLFRPIEQELYSWRKNARNAPPDVRGAVVDTLAELLRVMDSWLASFEIMRFGMPDDPYHYSTHDLAGVVEASDAEKHDTVKDVLLSGFKHKVTGNILQPAKVLVWRLPQV